MTRAKIRTMIVGLLLCVLLNVGCAKKAQPVTPNEPVSIDSGFRKTVLYFQDENSLMVPVMKKIPWEAGIGSAALNYLVNTPENFEKAQTLGLQNVFNEQTTFSLNIGQDIATVNIKNIGTFENAQKENNAITALVNTLVEFPAVKSVRVLVDGKKDVVLAHGKDLSQNFEKQDLNVETIAPTQEMANNKLIVYFASANSQLNMPVTRYLFDTPTLQSAVLELIKGPNDVAALKSCFPQETRIKSIKTKQNVAIIDFSKEFETIQEHPELEQRAIETLYLTCKEFGIDEIQIKTNGKQYKTGAKTSAPAFANIF